MLLSIETEQVLIAVASVVGVAIGLIIFAIGVADVANHVFDEWGNGRD